MTTRTRTSSISSSPATLVCSTIMAVWLVMISVPAPAAGPAYWDWPAGRSFEELHLEGAALDQNGHLVPGLAAQVTGPEGSEVYWSLAGDGQGGFFTGAGHDGAIYHTDSRGRTGLFAQLGATEVLSLLYVPKGGLYAGTGPEGKLFHLDSSGQVKLLGTTDGGYIWALAQGNRESEVWVAAGSPAALLHYDQESGLEQIAVLPATNALDVMRGDDGRLYVATQGPGLVYRFDPDRLE